MEIQLINLISLGADPEVFIKSKKTGKFVSAHDIIPGSKKDPAKLSPTAFMHPDGMAAEFGIEPTTSMETFTIRVVNAVNDLQKHIDPTKYEVVITPSVEFDEETFYSAPIHARELGCDPEYNAWTGDICPKPNPFSTLRTAGGHIHIGWTSVEDPFSSSHFEDCCTVAKELDYILGIRSLSIDNDHRRRTMYGLPGSFRPKPYGLEYRVLSNFWIKNTELAYWVALASLHTMQRLLGINGNKDTKYQSIFGNLPLQIFEEARHDWYNNKKYSKLFLTLKNPPPSKFLIAA